MNFAIIVAAGKGRRMGKETNKVLLPLSGKPVIFHTIKKFQDCNLVDEIIIVTQKNDINKILQIKKDHDFGKIKKIIIGGKERQDSVYNGLMSIKNAKDSDIVLVHNGSNPLVSISEISECIEQAKKHGAAVAAFPLKDTIKKIKNGFVEKTLDRAGIYQMQTPQAIQYGLLVEAFHHAKKKRAIYTDDVSLVESIGKKVKIVECSYKNIKLTTPEDMEIAEGIMMKKNNSCNPRIGFGQDSHRFSGEKKKLILGGYHVKNEQGLEANSDGDVILHALFNAISTAIGGRSLGYYSDEMCKSGITDSKEYLNAILDKLKEKNYAINNVSIMVEAAEPKLEKHTGKIKKSLSKILKIEEEKIGIAYTSGERLTSFGKGEGMQCFAVVTIK